MWMGGKKRGLRQFVTAILQKGPRNGAELMSDMEVMTHGWWRPSPGSIYPLLEELVKDGTVRQREDGRYELVGGPSFDRGWFTVGPRNVEDALREISGLTAFLEDLHRTEGTFPASSVEALKKVEERLRRLQG
jgi:hypothetical protein